MQFLARTIAIIGITLGLTLVGCSKHGNGHDDDDHGHVHADDADGNGHADDHPDDDAGHGADDHQEVPLGTAAVGDLQVQCAQGHGETAAGKEMHLVVKLPHNDNGSTVVRAWIGTEDRLASMVAKGDYAPSHDDYDIHAQAPSPLPAGAKWWIEVEQPDGTKSVGSIAFR